MQIIWLNRQNTIDLALELDELAINVPAALDSTNKLGLRMEDKDGVVNTFDSVTNPTYFSVIQRYVQGSLLRVFSIALGAAALNEGDYECVLTLYDAVHTLGVVIHEFRAQVRTA
jgi:hypothetical protein